jgi:hypothetical protein
MDTAMKVLIAIGIASAVGLYLILRNGKEHAKNLRIDQNEEEVEIGI